MTGVALAILGIAVVVGMPKPGGACLGLICILAGTASLGLGQALIRLKARVSIRQLIGAMSFLAVPQLFAVSLLVEDNHLGQLVTGSACEWFGVALLGVGSFVVAYMIWYGLLERTRMCRSPLLPC